MRPIQERIAEAKAQGYSDAETSDHLASTPEYADKIRAAPAAGYGSGEIIGRLATASAKPVKSGFDLSTAKPVNGGFDLSTAKPVTTSAPAKPFGQQLNDSVADMPRQIGLTARYGIEGAGEMLNVMATPFRAGMNLLLPKQQTMSGLVAGTGGRDAIQPINFRGLADAAGLPEPRTALERVVGDASRTVAGGMLPIAAAGRVAQGATGATRGVAQTFAANPLQQLISAGSAGSAGGYVRETGGNDTSQLLASVAAGVAAPYAMGKAQQAGAALGRMARGAPPVPPTQIDIQINNALQPNGMTLGELPAQIQAGIRKDVADAFKISGSTSPDAIRRLADYRLTGSTPTAAGLTLDPGTVTRQKNLAKLGINSKDASAQALGRTENANNGQLIEGLNKLGAGTSDASIGGGRRIMNALADRNDTANSLIGGRYAAARATSGRSAALDPHAFTNQANNLLDEALLGGKLPADVRNLLNKAAAGKMPLTVDTAEQFKTRIGELQRSTIDMAERKALGLVRQSLDDTPLLDGQGQGAIDAFNKARRLNRSWMQIVEKTPALQAVRDGIEPDKFVQQFIVGTGPKANVADLAALRSSVKSSPDAMAAVKEQITAHLKAKALGGAADEVGNISQSAYNKALNAIGDEKLAMFFSKADVDQLKAIGRVASYEQFQPRGSAVNNANTAGTALANILDRIGGSSLLSKIPLGNALSQPIQNIAVGMQSGRALSVPNALAGPYIAPVRQRNALMMSPAALMGREDEN